MDLIEKKKKRNTKQKAIVFQVVQSSHDHPTAETIYERAKKELQTISLGTVYRILKELVAEGKIKEIIVNKQSRFDPNTDFHHHFICKKCGKIEDVKVPLCRYTCKKLEEKNYIIEEIEYKFYGLCDKCCAQNLGKN
ncbi:Fur family transcriptional regulator [Desulfurobacterium thermolithotrophum]|uniref:Fur family transcriptional regulator n=1 Tax=Desulfurobacterium thermolithotrophum TaxID=64160 RepID=UPI0013D45FDF|nr:transcriptional repressor [Desulfurobacterium thermolithotrophum]